MAYTESVAFVAYYGFATWVVCYPDGSLHSAHSNEAEAEQALNKMPLYQMINY